jgi:hypothetical protein
MRSTILATALLVALLPCSVAHGERVELRSVPGSARRAPAPLDRLRAAAPGDFCGTRLESVLELLELRATVPTGAPVATPNSTDIGEIAVLEDDGTFFIASPQGHPLLDPAQVARAFYGTHGDDYDFLAMYCASGLNDWLGSPGALASAFVIRNDISGIGLGNFDLGESFGPAPPNLQMIMKMNGLHRYPVDPYQEFPNDSMNGVEVLAHEMAHRWVAYTYVDSAGFIVPALLGRGDAHWNFFCDSDASIMEGCDWSPVGPDSFQSVGVFNTLSPLEHYLMGIRTKAEVDPFFVINDPTDIQPPGIYVPYSIPYVGITMKGTPTSWSIDDIEAANGPRVPASTSGPSTVRVGFILVTAKGQAATAGDLTKIENLRQAIPTFWNVSTAGRGFVDATLQSQAGHVHIEHEPLPDTEDSLSARPLSAVIKIGQAGIPIALDPASARVYWRAGTSGPFAPLVLTQAVGDTFVATLPGLPQGGIAQYYLYASSDSTGIDAFHPDAAAAAPHVYVAGADNTPPVLAHTPVHEQGTGRMPQTLLAVVDDNVAVDSVWIEHGVSGGPLTSSTLAIQAGRDSFKVTLGAGLAEGQKRDYVVHARDAAGNETISQTVAHTLVVGKDWLFDFENGDEGFTHRSDWGAYRDFWHMSTEDGSPASPGTSWKMGDRGSGVYPPHIMAGLRVPGIPVVPPGTVLRFDHRYELEAAEIPGYAWDGVRVEGAPNGTNQSLVPLTPVGGYSHLFLSGAGPFPQNSPCWSGSSGGWVSEEVDLTSLSPGPAFLRFVMRADEFVGDVGWFVDHVRIDFPGANVGVGSPLATPTIGRPWPNPARTALRQGVALPRGGSVTWALFDVGGRRVATLWRGAATPGPVELSAAIPAGLRSGLYFTRIEIDGVEHAAGRVVVLR